MKLRSSKDALKDAELAYEEYIRQNQLVGAPEDADYRGVGSPQRGHDKTALRVVGDSIRRQIRNGHITRDMSEDQQIRAAYRVVPVWLMTTIARSLIEWMVRWYINHYFTSIEPIGAKPDESANN